eukprot:TRINITY_DN18505_c0_g1_i1.p1 TRINITY_DN18505_c0_g1~~TRINITY_DN18505_c0_g1_i1.p1  ORF type:complete len:555 (+),score=82.97 TRINITY_DN18505_c0_g1_i1:109-1665(+)
MRSESYQQIEKENAELRITVAQLQAKIEILEDERAAINGVLSQINGVYTTTNSRINDLKNKDFSVAEVAVEDEDPKSDSKSDDNVNVSVADSSESEGEDDAQNTSEKGKEIVEGESKTKPSHEDEHVTKVTKSLIEMTDGYILDKCTDIEKCTKPNLALAKSEAKDRSWFRDFFVARDHSNLLCTRGPLAPVIISITVHKHENEDLDFYRIICRSREGEQKVVIPVNSIDPDNITDSLMLQVNPLLKGYVIPCPDPALELMLVDYEAKMFPKHFKFGILYCKPGQTSEGEMFNNKKEDMSADFTEFLNILGDTIKLNGFTEFSGGLDTKCDQTGKESVYTVWEGNEIMFHVSTLLPYTENDPQQIEKKRHIGNDIVTVVFQDVGTNVELAPNIVLSKFTEILIVVRAEGDGTYRASVSRKRGTPPFHPHLCNRCTLAKDERTREILLATMVLGEMAAYKGPSFLAKIRDARNVMLTNYILEFCQQKRIEGEIKKKNRRSRGLSSVLIKSLGTLKTSSS